MAIVKNETRAKPQGENGKETRYMKDYREIAAKIETAGREGNLPKFLRLKRELVALTEPPMGSSC